MWRCGGKRGRAIVGALAAGARGDGAADVEDAAVRARLRQTGAQFAWRNGGCRRHQFWTSCGFALSYCAEQDRLCVWQV